MKNVIADLGIVAVFLAASTASGQQVQSVTPVEPPPFGTFFSMQMTDWPPFPFNPFPDLPLYEIREGVYVYDDRSVDYSANNAGKTKQGTKASGGGGGAQTMSGPLPPGCCSGGGGGGGASNPPPYSVAGLKLTIPLLTNSYIYTTILEHNPAVAYDIYAKTNLNSTNWTFASWGVVGQTNYYLLQSSFPWNVFLMAASNVDTDGDGMPDNCEVTYGLNPNSAADASQDSDGDGLTNWQEFQQGSNPTSAPTFQVFITSPRSILP